MFARTIGRERGDSPGIENPMIWRRRFGIEIVAVIVMALVLCVLAIYQYRWTGEISRTEQTRLRNSLATSVRNFDQEFSYDFQRLCENFELDPEAQTSSAESRVTSAAATWDVKSDNARLVDGLFIWKTESSNADNLEAFDKTDHRFHDAMWPPDLGSLRHVLEKRDGLHSSRMDDREAIYFPWTFFGDPPALVRPIFRIERNATGTDSGVQSAGMLIVKLNREYTEREYLPDLVNRAFGGPGERSFVVSVRTSQAPYQTIYLSDPNSPILTSSVDASVNLFDLAGEEARRRGHPPLRPSAPGEQWQLVARHPAGSLEEAVTAWRRRNLAISLGLLAVLALSMALIFSGARRSKTLARMQMEFVAGVSHELCTPLAVINSAAENLADGVVENPEQMQEYGGLIRGQGQRLERLVDEVLLFTAGRFGLAGYEMKPVEIREVVTQSLAVAETNLREAGFTVAKEIEHELPPILADASAVVTCIENLVSNAVKYSNSSKWIGIRAYESKVDSKSEVRISVEDKGLGIARSELPHIYEPFYRAQSVRDHQIRGVGLGLYLVKRMMEDMGGQVSVTSELGRGTTVVLHFPITGVAASESTA
jgi:signal transduction histidine kinase